MKCRNDCNTAKPKYLRSQGFFTEPWSPCKATLISKHSFRTSAHPPAQQRFKGRQGGRQQDKNKPHFLQAKQWPKSIRKIKRRNIPLPVFILLKSKWCSLEGFHWASSAPVTWMMLGWGPGNVKSGNKWNKGSLGGTFPLGKAQNTPSSWHHPPGVPQLVCLLIFWQLYKLLLGFFFLQGKLLPEVKWAMGNENQAGKRFGKWLRANKTEIVQKEWLHWDGRLQQIQLAASRKGCHRSCRE